MLPPRLPWLIVCPKTYQESGDRSLPLGPAIAHGFDGFHSPASATNRFYGSILPRGRTTHKFDHLLTLLSTGMHMKTNEQLQRDVMDALRWEPLLNASDIGVTARDGVITLTGYVDSYPKKLAAERVAKNVAGVKAVAEEIDVHLQTSNQKTDTEIAEEAVHALRWCSNVPDDRIQVSVENGWVKLEGEVEWEYQKSEARHELEDLIGVRGISNFIMVKPRVKPADVKDKIRRAFERSATVDANKIAIDVNGSIVTLRGPVRSWAEREDAESAAWSAPGVTQVKDELRVGELEEIY